MFAELIVIFRWLIDRFLDSELPEIYSRHGDGGFLVRRKKQSGRWWDVRSSELIMQSPGYESVLVRFSRMVGGLWCS